MEKPSEPVGDAQRNDGNGLWGLAFGLCYVGHRVRVSLFWAFVLSGCADAQPPPHASTKLPGPPLSATVAKNDPPNGMASAPGAPTGGAAPSVALSSLPSRPPLPTTVGDVTCSADADCTTTTLAECCDCCGSNSRATSKAWLAWRDGTQCPKIRCEPCAKVKCPYFGDPASFHAVCDHGSCSLVSPP